MMYGNLKKKSISSILVLSALFLTSCSPSIYSEDFIWGEKKVVEEIDRDCILTSSAENISSEFDNQSENNLEFSEDIPFVRPVEPLSNFGEKETLINEYYRPFYPCRKDMKVASILNGHQLNVYEVKLSFDASVEHPVYQSEDIILNQYLLKEEPVIENFEYFGDTPFFYRVETTNNLKTLMDEYVSPFQSLNYVDIESNIRNIQLVDLVYFYQSDNTSYHKEKPFNEDFIDVFYEIFSEYTHVPSPIKTDYPYAEVDKVIDYLNSYEHKYEKLYVLSRDNFKQLFSEGRYSSENNFDIYKASAWIPYDISYEELRERLWNALEQ